jgi:hypothetical protein
MGKMNIYFKLIFNVYLLPIYVGVMLGTFIFQIFIRYLQ